LIKFLVFVVKTRPYQQAFLFLAKKDKTPLEISFKTEQIKQIIDLYF